MIDTGYVVGAVLVALPLLGTVPQAASALVASRTSVTLFLLASLVAAASALAYAAGGITGNAAVVLCAPLYQLSLIASCFHVFVRIVGRPPIDTFLNWQPGLAGDRIYALLVFLLGVLVPLFLLKVPVAARAA